MEAARGRAPGSEGMNVDDWYRDAIFYELHVRAFADGNGDGIGDFPGLIDRLDYVRDLGVDCIWLLPIYPSPLRDDGYDIADYTGIHPDYGTLEDFQRFLDAAHHRGLRVIADLVINHTSDQHPWFQAARRSPDSPYRGYYVWSDTDQRYRDARIIFRDSEVSNWTWDPIARQYYWHRFYHHQPDLNFENPAVRAAMLDVMRTWLDRGLDGFRCDAVPYLFEREGTSCENLPETHAYLKELRSEIDARYRGRILFAEANQWPADVLPYFGQGDECHMAFNFPLMPRIFMALRREERRPIIDIVRQTPDLPDACQWGIFLRNHDELTLEMVTDDERDYMYLEYAKDARMRLNLGIRRRLAPLMENGRRQMELLHSLLFSLPGSPVLYYGDEIGMGDNIFLGDRNGVRTPMQWSGDRNAGFSRADPERVYAPVNQNPVYHYQYVNVETQLRTPTSLLNWVRRLIKIRKRYPIFGRGGIEFLLPENEKILAYVRENGNQAILVANNLSRFSQAAELNLRRFAGRVPVEMHGETVFPKIGELPYLLTFAPHGFYWFRLERVAP
jgi:maltose alpha-D-glucosyltransferase/alpha-amylase